MPRKGPQNSTELRSTVECVELGAPSRGPFFSPAAAGDPPGGDAERAPYSPRRVPTMRWKVTSIPAVAPQMNRPRQGIAQ